MEPCGSLIYPVFSAFVTLPMQRPSPPFSLASLPPDLVGSRSEANASIGSGTATKTAPHRISIYIHDIDTLAIEHRSSTALRLRRCPQAGRANKSAHPRAAPVILSLQLRAIVHAPGLCGRINRANRLFRFSEFWAKPAEAIRQSAEAYKVDFI
jgi:hypothetical protein